MPIASTLISLVRLTSNYFKEAKKKKLAWTLVIWKVMPMTY